MFDVNKRVLIIGCGGLGGYVIEELARTDSFDFVLFDGDKFDFSNMNRQLLATNDTIGQFKAETYAKRIQSISSGNATYYNKNFDVGDESHIATCDVVVDCVDNLETRLLLSSLCKKHNKVLVHGAIDGEEGQVMACFPGDDSLEKLFSQSVNEEHKTNAYSVATVASIEASVVYKVLMGDRHYYKGKLIVIDLETPTVQTVNF